MDYIQAIDWVARMNRNGRTTESKTRGGSRSASRTGGSVLGKKPGGVRAAKETAGAESRRKSGGLAQAKGAGDSVASRRGVREEFGEDLLTQRDSAAPFKRSRNARSGKQPSQGCAPAHLLDSELAAWEAKHTDGMTVGQVLSAFAERGIHLSEATFRKYVQLGLLGRSRRVGRKGKHQGSLGLYPATTVRRLNTIRQMLAAHYTIEDIQRSFLRFSDEIDGVQRTLSNLLDGLERELGDGRFGAERRRAMSKEISAVRKLADETVRRIEAVERELLSPLKRAARQRTFGAGGGSDDLL